MLETLSEMDAAFAAYAQANPKDAGRQAQWRSARSQLVDQFLSVNGQNTPMQTFANPSCSRDRAGARRLRARAAGGLLPAARGLVHLGAQQLSPNAGATIGGPTFAPRWTSTRPSGRTTPAAQAPEQLLTYLVDAGSNNDALAELMASTDDIIQVMRDDANLVPLYHVLAAAVAPTTTDASGNLQRGVLDATTALLARSWRGSAYDAKGRTRSARASSIPTPCSTWPSRTS